MTNQKEKCRVAILDDSTIVRERLTAMLSENPDVDIISQSSLPFEAVRAIRNERPDIAILDISMPGGSGIEVLQLIKKEKLPSKVVMLTNFGHEQARQRCLQLGADYFFDKSTEFEKILSLLPSQETPESALPIAG